MLKVLALSASVLAFASGLALAETTMAREPSTGRSVVTNPSSSLSTAHWLASDVYKADFMILPNKRLARSPIL